MGTELQLGRSNSSCVLHVSNIINGDMYCMFLYKIKGFQMF